MKRGFVFLAALAMFPAASVADGLEQSLQQYRDSGAGPFDAGRGAEMWRRQVSVDGQARSCVDCHGSDLATAGEHVRTGKRIEPMAVSVNPKRLTDGRDIHKWFLRNCKWAWGRECTPQEKGDFLAFIRSQ